MNDEPKGRRLNYGWEWVDRDRIDSLAAENLALRAQLAALREPESVVS